MRPPKAVWLAAVGLLFACSLTRSLDSLTNRACPAGQKACDDRCVPIDDPSTGCAAVSCAPCNIQHGVPACVAGGCGFSRCDANFDDCDRNPANGCEADLENDANNCTSCGRECSAFMAGALCNGGECHLLTCRPPFRDCNTTFADGCEINIATDSQHCGDCSNVCPSGHPCAGGTCLTATAVATSASSEHVCAILSARSLVCWGSNGSGQLGIGATCTTPPCSVTSAQPVALAGVTAVAAGKSHTCAAATGGQVLCWGGNGFGQVGLGTVDATPHPNPHSIDLADVIALAAGDAHTCALRKTGSVACWGEGDFGETGVAGAAAAVSKPTNVMLGGAPLGNIVGIAAGGHSTCAVTGSGEVYCWGDDRHGQLGQGGVATEACGGTGVSRCSATPRLMAGVNDAKAVAVGASVTCVLLNTGGIECSGDGTDGKLGTGDDTSSNVPRPIYPVLGLGAYSTISVSFSHACAVQAGRLWCWGRNTSGELGVDPSVAASRSTPTPFGTSVDVSSPALGEGFTCLIAGGEVRCAGSNELGQLGRGGIPDGAPHSDLVRVAGAP